MAMKLAVGPRPAPQGGARNSTMHRVLLSPAIEALILFMLIAASLGQAPGNNSVANAQDEQFAGTDDPVIAQVRGDLERQIWFEFADNNLVPGGVGFPVRIVEHTQPGPLENCGLLNWNGFTSLRATDWLANQIMQRLVGIGLQRVGDEMHVLPALRRLAIGTYTGAYCPGMRIYNLGRFRITEAQVANKLQGLDYATGGQTQFRTYRFNADFIATPALAALVPGARYGHVAWTAAFKMNPVTLQWEFASFGGGTWWPN